MSGSLRGDAERFTGGLHDLGGGAWAWLQPNAEWGEANAGLVRGDGASALIDTLWDQRLAREMLAAMAPRTEGAPIRLVINTHSDGDHWWGNAEAPAGAEILTSEAALQTMREEPPPSTLARQRRLCRVLGLLPGFLPGGFGEMGRYVGEMLSPFEFGEVEARLPDRTFADRATETVGGRELNLIYVGPAHTPGDLVVHLPDADVVFGADILFFESTPVMWHGPVENWLAALDTVLSLDAETYVPGHGPVGGREDVQQVRDYLEWVADGVGRQHAVGCSAYECALALIADSQFERWRGWACPERMMITVTTIHRALSGKGPVPTTIAARAQLFARVCELSTVIERR